MSNEEAAQTGIPWHVVALVVGVMGVAVAALLGTVNPPPPVAPPGVVEHVQPDMGGWDPFVDVGMAAADSTWDSE